MQGSQEQLIKSLQDYFNSQPVLKAYLFGSFARNEQTKESDLDVLIEFDPAVPIGLEFCQIYLDLKKITGREVDLVTQQALSKYITPFVEKEKVLIYEERPDDAARLYHVRDAIFEIEKFISGLSIESFKEDSKTIYATIKLLEIIGEASYHISEKLKKENPEIPWQQIAALRHILVHEYYGIQHEILWRIITSDLPPLKEKIVRLITSYKSSSL